MVGASKERAMAGYASATGADAGRAPHTLAQGDFTEVFTWAQAAQHACPVTAVDDLDLAIGDHIKAVPKLTRPNDLVAGLEAHPRQPAGTVHLQFRDIASEETGCQPIKEQPATPPPIWHIAEKQQATSKNTKPPLHGPAPDLSYRVAPTHDSDLGDAFVLDAPERLAA